MHLIFRKEEIAKVNAQMAMPEPEVKRPLWQTTVYFALMVAILVFANWGKPDMQEGFFFTVHAIKWYLTGFSAAAFAVILVLWFNLAWSKIVYAAVPTVVLAFLFPHEPLIPFGAAVIGLSVITSKDPGEAGEWFSATWGFAKQITPLLLGGVLVSGLLLGRPGNEGIIPNAWVTNLVGGNSLWANLFASIVGAFMYFATLTEVPILQGLNRQRYGKRSRTIVTSCRSCIITAQHDCPEQHHGNKKDGSVLLPGGYYGNHHRDAVWGVAINYCIEV